jgi:hypothetical protein
MGGNLRSLTERSRASDIAREVPVIIPRSRVRPRRRSEVRIHTQSLHLKHLVRLLHNLSQPNRLLQLGLPVQPRLDGLGVQGIQTSQPTVVMDRTRVNHSSVVDSVGAHAHTGRTDVLGWTFYAFFPTKRQNPSTTLGRRIRERCQGEKVQGDGLYRG